MPALALVAALRAPLAWAAGVADDPDGAREVPGFYTQDLAAEFRKLASPAGCPRALLQMSESGSPPLLRVRIQAKGKVAGRGRVLLIFGEHARELVGPESALHLARSACAGDAREALAAGVQFDILPDLNPVGRQEVLAGRYCQRMDQRDVDLNRNYGEGAHWSSSVESDFRAGETNPGGAPFSEPATQLVRRLVADPGNGTGLLHGPAAAFAAVHSGELAMFVAPAWTEGVDPALQGAGAPAPVAAALDRASAMVSAVQAQHCPDCVAGPLGQYEGFALRGTSLDYAAGLGVPAALFEIYVGSDDMKSFQEFQSAIANYQKERQAQGRGLSFMQRQDRKKLGAAPTHKAEYTAEEEASCLQQFNPLSRADFDSTLARWTATYLDFARAALQPKGPA